jgi:hypothetical protein
MRDRTLNRLGIAAISAVAWYFVFWYFYLPEQPYTFKNELGWRVMPNQFPYSSSTTLEELPALLQQVYLLGYVGTIAIVLIADWIIQGIVDVFA